MFHSKDRVLSIEKAPLGSVVASSFEAKQFLFSSRSTTYTFTPVTGTPLSLICPETPGVTVGQLGRHAERLTIATTPRVCLVVK
jgi:hypothetical protein